MWYVFKHNLNIIDFLFSLREAVKKIPLLMARPLMPPAPSPLELNGHRNFFINVQKLKKKVFLPNGPAFNPLTLLMAWQLAEELF